MINIIFILAYITKIIIQIYGFQKCSLYFIRVRNWTLDSLGSLAQSGQCLNCQNQTALLLDRTVLMLV